MKLALLVYFAGISGKVSLMFFNAAIILLIYLVHLTRSQPDFSEKQIYQNLDDEGEKERKRAFNRSIPILKFKALKRQKVILCTAVLSGFMAAIIPQGSTIYLMAGAYATEQIASNERAKKIGADVLAVIENKLAEMKGEDKKEAKADAEG